MQKFDVLVIGAGHAGCEAAHAAARLGCRVGLCTLSRDTVAHMPCNPAVGGTAKGHLVREIDALGGVMGEAIDATGIQFKLLNRSRGPAVWSPRAQADKKQYGLWMKNKLEQERGIEWIISQAGALVVEQNKIIGVELEDGDILRCRSVVVTTGTFLNGLIHIGPETQSAGRFGERATHGLAESLKMLGLRWGRLKTGTPPRLDRRSIDFTVFEEAPGDDLPVPFSFMSEEIRRPQIMCHLVHTNDQIRDLVRSNIDKSPLYNGQINGVGPRYCPSLEDKVMRFPKRERHQVFLEPEGLDVNEIYVNGYSMSLPRHVQEELVHALPGLENAKMIRPGYAVEYDFVQPTELFPTFETKRVEGLFLAGQVNGTSGYEEAGAQGLLAGLNAGRRSRDEDGIVIGRDEGYIGVLADDLTSKGCLEPYRMFTSRAEHRLLLRIDNADLRLTKLGRKAGLINDERWDRFECRRARFESNKRLLTQTTVRVGNGERLKASKALRRPTVQLEWLLDQGELDLQLQSSDRAIDIASVETEFKYAGYLQRQSAAVKRSLRYDRESIPTDFCYLGLPGLSREMIERLTEIKPVTLGQAQRIPGVTPAAVGVIEACLRRDKKNIGKGVGHFAPESTL
tara:strand:+ start:38493 stop:40367 length:1875 start_codon:yes stop_codon:yes gene_type:complete